MTTTLIDSARAAEHLDAALGDGAAYWLRYLQNNRRTGRRPGYRIPVYVARGRSQYLREQLDDFIAHERRRRISSGRVPVALADVVAAVRGAGGSRALSARVSTEVDQSTGAGYVEIVTANPLLVYHLRADEAHSLAATLIAAATACSGSGGAGAGS